VLGQRHLLLHLALGGLGASRPSFLPLETPKPIKKEESNQYLVFLKLNKKKTLGQYKPNSRKKLR
jgi:hypothetical protein